MDKEQKTGIMDAKEPEVKAGGFAEQVAPFVANIYEKSDPKDKSYLERIVYAGQKVMFTQTTHKLMQSILDKPGEMADKLGYGVVELMGMLFKQSNGKIPPQLIIPAGAILLTKACEFVEKTGDEMNMDIFSDALEVLVAGLKKNLSGIKAGEETPPEAPVEAPAEAPVEAPEAGLLNAPQGV